MKYYYVACEASDEQKVNPEFKHYFRLYYGDVGTSAILVEQGLAIKINDWEQRFGAVFENENPYPELD
jgi:hypothetical protein